MRSELPLPPADELIPLRLEEEPLAAIVDAHRIECNALLVHEQRQHLILDAMPVMVAALDRRNRVVYWNKECERVTGYAAEEIASHPEGLRLLCPRSPLSETLPSPEADCRTDFRDREWEITRKDGETRTILCSNVSQSVPIPGWRVWGTAVDVTERTRAAEYLATTDGLTHLKNHRAFQEQLQQEFLRVARYKTPLSLLLIDVDKFKKYNDTFGHPAGDEVLVTIAQHLKSFARVTDFVARYGGEEFAVILPETDAAGAQKMAERFRQAVEALRWRSRRVTISVGIATLDEDLMPSPAHLIAAADEALYASKRAGRNCVTHIGEIR